MGAASGARGRFPPWAPLALIAVLGLAYRLSYLLEQGEFSPLFTQPMLDEAEALSTARSILAGHGFGEEPLFKAPLYPAILAGFLAVSGEGVFWTVRLFQHLLGTLLIVIGYDSARRLVGTGQRARAAGLIAAGVLAMYPPLVRLENRLILDYLVVFLQSAMVWALIRAAGGGAKRWALLAGVLVALAFLTRPTVLVVTPFVAVWLIGWKPRRALSPRRLVPALLFVLPLVVAAGALGWRNAKAGEFMILPWQGGFNLYEANRPGASGRYLAQARLALGGGDNPTWRLAIDGYLKAVERGEVESPAGDIRYGDVNAWWNAQAREAILDDPVRWLGLMTRKAVYLVSEREIFNFEDFRVQKRESAYLRWNPLGFGVIWPLALASLALMGSVPRGRRRLWALMWVYAVALAMGIALYYTSSRMRAPLVFPALLLGSAGLACAPSLVRAKAWKRTGVAGLLLVAGVALSWGDWWGVRSEVTAHAEYERLANASWRAGRPQQSLEYVDKLAELKPRYPTLPLLRAQALYSLGEIDASEAQFRLAAAALPTDPIPAFNLGVILYQDEERWRESGDWFGGALARDPSYWTARPWYSLYLVRSGDVEFAEVILGGGPPPYSPYYETARVAISLAKGDTDEAARWRARAVERFGPEAEGIIDEEIKRLGLGD